MFCLESAAILSGTPVFGEPRDVHLFDPAGRTWREGDVVVHGSRDVLTFAYEGHIDRTDFSWRRLRLLGESDGYGKYDAEDVESTKQHFIREKQREDRLRRYEGGFARWDGADAVEWKGLDRKLAALATNPRSLPPGSRQHPHTRRGRGSAPKQGV